MRKIVKRVETLLEKAGYDYCNCSGCFDVAAKKGKKIVLLKILGNVDSIQEEQTNNLKTTSQNLDAMAVVVGERTRRENLEEGIVYKRFDVPTVNTKTLENIFFHESPLLMRARGGLFIEIDARLLKKRRQALGMTQTELAKKIGTTKKSIYEHERASKKAPQEIVEKLEDTVGPVSAPVSIGTVKESAETKPRGRFEGLVSRHFNSIGFETSIVYQAPFNIIARGEKLILLSEAQENSVKIERIMEEMINFSRLARKPILAVTKDEVELEIPTLREKELRNYSAKDIRKLIGKW